jgi:hypothetical protein
MTRASAWRQIRALLVTFHLGVIVLAAVPAPDGGMDPAAWRDPGVQAEFAMWARWFGVTPARLESTLWSVAMRYMQTRGAIMRPLHPYLDVTGAWQPWRLFVAPHRFPARFELLALRAGADPNAWRVLFRERSRTETWHSHFFGVERVRSAVFRYSWPSFARDAGNFCGWLADRVFDERPDVTAVRCRYGKQRSPTPDEARRGYEPEVTYVNDTTFPRREGM